MTFVSDTVSGMIAAVLSLVYFQVSLEAYIDKDVLKSTLWTVFFILTIIAGIGATRGPRPERVPACDQALRPQCRRDDHPAQVRALAVPGPVLGVDRDQAGDEDLLVPDEPGGRAVAEALHGEAQVRLDADHTFDRDRRICIIDSETKAGQDVCRLFTGYLRREFTPDQYTIRRVDYSIAGPRVKEASR